MLRTRPGTTTLAERDRRLLALWAADCAERVLPIFEECCPGDDRPRTAMESGRAWGHGALDRAEACRAAEDAHLAARTADYPPARCAARSAGNAASTAAATADARHAATYAMAAVRQTDDAGAARRERAWQQRKLPDHLRLTFPTPGSR